MRLSILASTTFLAACAITSASSQTSVDRTFTATGDSCRDVEWSKEILREYPGIAAACQSVERRNSKTFVKFQGTVREVIDDGRQVRIDFKQGDTLTLAPPPKTVLYMDGQETPFSELKRGTALNFYVPEDQLTAQFFADATGAKSVAVPIVSEQPVAREQTVAREQSQPTQAIAERETIAARELPATAGGLPFVALSGVMFLVAGAGATLYRILRK